METVVDALCQDVRKPSEKVAKNLFTERMEGQAWMAVQLTGSAPSQLKGLSPLQAGP